MGPRGRRQLCHQCDDGADAGLYVKTVALWRTRFARARPKGLWKIAPGRGRKATYGVDKIKAIVEATLHAKPKGMPQWSCRQMVAAQGVSKSTVSDIWRSHNLKPHRIKSFKRSRDARFMEKLTNVVGLHLNPPEQAIALCVDEKTQILGTGSDSAWLAYAGGAAGHDDS